MAPPSELTNFNPNIKTDGTLYTICDNQNWIVAGKFCSRKGEQAAEEKINK